MSDPVEGFGDVQEDCAYGLFFVEAFCGVFDYSGDLVFG